MFLTKRLPISKENLEMSLIQYDTKVYNFGEIIANWFEVEDLSQLHTLKVYGLFDRAHDQSSCWHEIFYRKVREDTSFLELYESFIENVIKPRYGEEVIYQAIPSFRVHLSNNVAVGEYHKDKDYRESEWAEDVKEVNYYLPFTPTNRYNTIWIESEEDKKDFSPAILKIGECLEWDGANLTHGNVINKTLSTRVSVDFRVIPSSRYKESDMGSINTNTKFKIGEYYKRI